MSIYVVGQINNNFIGLKDKILNMSITNSIMIICGNFGLFNDDIIKSEELIDLNYHCILNDIILYVLRGNNDNPEFFDGRKILSNIVTLQDITEKRLNDKTFLFIGGGISIDRYDKYLKGKYFDNEKITIDFKRLNDFKNIDIIVSFKPEPYVFDSSLTNFISHWVVGDACLENQLGKERDELKRFFKKIKNNNNIKYIISSHINKSIEIMVKDIKHKSLASLEFYKII